MGVKYMKVYLSKYFGGELELKYGVETNDGLIFNDDVSNSIEKYFKYTLFILFHRFPKRFNLNIISQSRSDVLQYVGVDDTADNIIKVIDNII